MNDYNENIEDTSQTILNETTGGYKVALSDRELNFKFQLLKGRIAENLMQELFLSEGYQVFKFGIENNLPYLLQQIKGMGSHQALSLRVAPDLIIFEPISKGIHYVEVKFCSNGVYNLNPKINLDTYIACYPNTIFFIVSKHGILEVGIEQFRESRKIDLTDQENLISNRSIFNLRPKVIEQFEKMSLHLLSNISRFL